MIRILAALALAVMAGPVSAASQYAETRRGIGVAANGAVMELFTGASGSWTIAVTLPDGTMCLLATGQGYEAVDGPSPSQGVPG